MSTVMCRRDREIAARRAMKAIMGLLFCASCSALMTGTKKAPAERLMNQHPVVLCNTVYKLFSIILNSCLTRVVEENTVMEQEQAGGRRHYSTMRQLQWLQWQMGDAKRMRKRIYELWIDMTNTFGSVSKDVL